VRPFGADGTFVPPVPDSGGELRRLAVRGAGATLFAGGVTLAIQVIATMVLARLLTPTDFGLVAMVTTFSLLLVNFGFNGLTEAIVQSEKIDHALASTLFWINLAAGILLTVGFAATGSLIARFYHNPNVRGVTVGISLTILATSISVVHLALLKRAMQFSHISLNDICARVVAVAVSVILGVMGFGYWALVAGAVAVPLSTTIGAIIMCPWMPGIPRRVAGTGSMLQFAIHTYGNFLVNYFSRNTDNLLVGWRFDAQSLGYYKKAYDLFALSASQFVSSLTVVVVATLSRVKPTSNQYRRYLLAAMTVMAFVSMGLAADLTLVGRDLIRLLLGAKWEPAGRIFTYFGPGIGIMILYYTHGWIHLSIGRADRWFRWAIVEFIVTGSAFLVGLHWGPVGIAVGWTVSFWLLTLPAIWYAGKPIGLGIAPVLSVIWRYVTAAVIAGILTLLIMQLFPSLAVVPGAHGALIRLMVVSGFVVSLYLSSVVLLHGGFEPIYQVAGLFREMVQSRRRGTLPVDVPYGRTSDGEYDGPFKSSFSSEAMPLVSILIPAYNAEEWIADTIRSAIAQTWPRIEIIVVDDGSTDQTVAIARQFEPQGVRVVEQKNQGASAARNRAFSVSRGDYIQWLDADDLLAPDKIARQMQAVEQGADKLVLFSSPWAHFMYRPYRAQFAPTELWHDLSPVEWLLRKMGQNLYMQTATWLVSRELTEAAGPWDIRLLGDDDGEYFCRVLIASKGVRFVPEAKVYYRAFKFNSLSYIGRFPEKIEAHWLSMQLHIQYLRSLEDSQRVRYACLEFLRNSLIYFYPEERRIVSDVEGVALELGEPLGVPYLSWKYAWIEMVFGWKLAKPVQGALRKFRWWMTKNLDKALYRIERQNDSALSKDLDEKEGQDAVATGLPPVMARDR
jgi:O-antigen/teichoic acid export membrane protein/glycosyltransferase involved in cell wall biosynthesis